MEHFFCVFFSLELLIRFCAFQSKRDCSKDAWFVFDSCLVFVMVLDTWIISFITQILADGATANNVANANSALPNIGILCMARLLRLTCMARMARLLRSCPELFVLLKGMAVAVWSVFFILVLLFVGLYVFGIAFVQLLSGEELGMLYFFDVLLAMHNLWLYGALLEDQITMSNKICSNSLGCCLLFDLFMLFVALTVMNMFVGVLCEVVSAVASSEKEEMTLT